MVRHLLVLVLGIGSFGTLARAEDPPATKDADSAEPVVTELTPALSHAAFTEEFKRRPKTGFRPAHVSTAAVKRQYVYSVLWEKRAQPRFFMQPGFSSADFRAKNDELEEQGFLLVDFGSVFGDAVTHHGIWEQRNGPDLELQLEVSGAELERALADRGGRGFRLRSLGVAAGKEAVAYSAIWEEGEAGQQPREVDLDVPFSRVRGLVARRSRMGFRCLEAFGTDVDKNERYAFLWEKSEGPPQRVQVRLTKDALELARKEWEEKKGYRLRAANVYTHRDIARYAAVWDAAAKDE